MSDQNNNQVETEVGENLICLFCGKTDLTVDNAIPSFFDHDGQERCGYWEGREQCVCLTCVDEKLNYNETNCDYELKPGGELPPNAQPI